MFTVLKVLVVVFAILAAVSAVVFMFLPADKVMIAYWAFAISCLLCTVCAILHEKLK